MGTEADGNMGAAACRCGCGSVAQSAVGSKLVKAKARHCHREGGRARSQMDGGAEPTSSSVREGGGEGQKVSRTDWELEPGGGEKEPPAGQLGKAVGGGLHSSSWNSGLGVSRGFTTQLLKLSPMV